MGTVPTNRTLLFFNIFFLLFPFFLLVYIYSNKSISVHGWKELPRQYFLNSIRTRMPFVSFDVQYFHWFPFRDHCWLTTDLWSVKEKGSISKCPRKDDHMERKRKREKRFSFIEGLSRREGILSMCIYRENVDKVDFGRENNVIHGALLFYRSIVRL